MKLNCGPTWYERELAKQKWHRYFALWPRRVGEGDCRWLEHIERRKCINHFFVRWEYRLPEGTQ